MAISPLRAVALLPSRPGRSRRPGNGRPINGHPRHGLRRPDSKPLRRSRTWGRRDRPGCTLSRSGRRNAPAGPEQNVRARATPVQGVRAPAVPAVALGAKAAGARVGSRGPSRPAAASPGQAARGRAANPASPAGAHTARVSGLAKAEFAPDRTPGPATAQSGPMAARRPGAVPQGRPNGRFAARKAGSHPRPVRHGPTLHASKALPRLGPGASLLAAQARVRREKPAPGGNRRRALAGRANRPPAPGPNPRQVISPNPATRASRAAREQSAPAHGQRANAAAAHRGARSAVKSQPHFVGLQGGFRIARDSLTGKKEPIWQTALVQIFSFRRQTQRVRHLSTSSNSGSRSPAKILR